MKVYKILTKENVKSNQSPRLKGSNYLDIKIYNIFKLL